MSCWCMFSRRIDSYSPTIVRFSSMLWVTLRVLQLIVWETQMLVAHRRHLFRHLISDNMESQSIFPRFGFSLLFPLLLSGQTSFISVNPQKLFYTPSFMKGSLCIASHNMSITLTQRPNSVLLCSLFCQLRLIAAQFSVTVSEIRQEVIHILCEISNRSSYCSQNTETNE